MTSATRLKQAMKIVTIPRCVALCIFVAIAVFYYNGIPPSDRELIERFNENRKYYERIKNMLQEDKNLVYLTRDGALMDGSLRTIKLPSENISEQRTEEYRDILDKTHSLYALRRKDAGDGLCLMAWRWGFGDSKHVFLCWMSQEDKIIGEYSVVYNNKTRKNSAGCSVTMIDDGWYIVRD